MFEKLKYSWALAGLTAIAGVAALFVVGPDAIVTVHWNSVGEADDTGAAYIAFFIIPAVQAFVLLMFSALRFLEPRQANLEASMKAVKAMALGITGILALVQALIIGSAFGLTLMGPKMLIAGMGLMFAVMGNYFGKLKSSFFIGIRTPWTLSSDTVWRKTHRLGGKLFMLAGVVMFVAAPFFHIETLSTLILLTILPAALIPVVCSYIWWRQEKTVTALTEGD